MIFLFSGTKVTPHAAFVKGRFTLRVKNLLDVYKRQTMTYDGHLVVAAQNGLLVLNRALTTIEDSYPCLCLLYTSRCV